MIYGLGLLAIISAVAAGYWVLGPVSRKMHVYQLPTQFLLSDFFWLILQIQLILATCLRVLQPQVDDQWTTFALICGAGGVASLMMWLGGVSFLSRAGVRWALRRGVFLMILLPCALAFMLVPAGLAWVGWQLVGDALAPPVHEADADRKWLLVSAVAALVALTSGLLLAGLFLRGLAGWVLTGAQAPTGLNTTLEKSAAPRAVSPAVANRPGHA